MEKKGLSFEFNNFKLFISETFFYGLIVFLIIILFSIFLSYRLKKIDYKDKPKGIMLLIEIIYDWFVNFFSDEVLKKHLPFLFFIGFYILVSNLFGMVGLQAPTSNYSVVLGITIFSIVYIHYYGIKDKKGVLKYISKLSPFKFLIPFEIISKFAAILSLSFRLMGNLLVGAVISAIAFYILRYFSLPLQPFIKFYFDLFESFIQTFIYIFLLSNYLKEALHN